MKKNNHLIVILLVLTIMISLVYVYISSKYSGSNKTSTNSFVAQNSLITENNTIDTNNISEEENNTADINVGDNGWGIAHCAEAKIVECPSGYNFNDANGCFKYVVEDGPYTCLGQIIGDAGCPQGFSGRNCCGTTKTYRRIYTNPKKVKCTKCSDNYYAEDGKCKKCSITVIADRLIVSPGTKWYATATVAGSTDECQAISPAVRSLVANNACGKSTITFEYNGTKTSVTIRVAGDWESVEDNDNKVYDHDMVKSEKLADGGDQKNYQYIPGIGFQVTTEYADGIKMEYGNCTQTEEGMYKCTNVKQRGMCGSKPIKAYSYCCVNNQYVGVSDSVKWADHVLVNYDTKKNGKLGCAYYYGDDYTYANVTKDKCKVTESIPGRCTSSSVNVNNVNETTAECEGDHKITLYEGEKCTGKDLGTEGNDIKSTFYSISCTRNINANFDYGDDGITTTARELYRGQGFKYGITITSKVKCDGEFYGDRWKNVYKKLWEKVKNVDVGLENACKVFDQKGLEKCEAYINKMKFNKVKTKKDVFELLTIIRELVGIVDTYNNYAPNTNFDEEATINFTYTINGKKGVAKVDDIFSKNVVDKGVYAATSEKTVDLGVSGITNPKTYSRSNNSKPRKVKFTLKKVYLDKTDGAVKANPKEKLDGGNKIYIDYNADAQVISVNSMSIVVNGVTGGNSSITNNKCTIIVKDQDLLYRPIDVSNPFINTSWEKGNNWSNSQFDFTNVIHSDVWIGNDCYSIYSNGTWGKCKG